MDDGTADRSAENEEETMNAKGSWIESIASALLVGVIVAGAARWGTRGDDTRDQVVALRAQVAEVVKQLDRLNEAPYVRRDEFSRAENGISGLEQRVSVIERQK